MEEFQANLERLAEIRQRGVAAKEKENELRDEQLKLMLETAVEERKATQVAQQARREERKLLVQFLREHVAKQ